MSKRSLSEFRDLLDDKTVHLGGVDGLGDQDDEDSFLGEYVVSVSNGGVPGGGGIYQIDEEQSDARRSDFEVNPERANSIGTLNRQMSLD